MRTILSLTSYILSGILIIMVRMYQIAISPLIKWTMGDVCRFYPSCSQYFIEAVRKYGPIRGALKGIWRVIRCNPWCKGGYDPPWQLSRTKFLNCHSYWIRKTGKMSILRRFKSVCSSWKVLFGRSTGCLCELCIKNFCNYSAKFLNSI